MPYFREGPFQQVKNVYWPDEGEGGDGTVEYKYAAFFGVDTFDEYYVADHAGKYGITLVGSGVGHYLYLFERKPGSSEWRYVQTHGQWRINGGNAYGGYGFRLDIGNSWDIAPWYFGWGDGSGSDEEILWDGTSIGRYVQSMRHDPTTGERIYRTEGPFYIDLSGMYMGYDDGQKWYPVAPIDTLWPPYGYDPITNPDVPWVPVTCLEMRPG